MYRKTALLIALLLPVVAEAMACGAGNHFIYGRCLPCPTGTFQTAADATTCRRCNITQYTRGPGSTSCIECPPTRVRTFNATCGCARGMALNPTTDRCESTCRPGFRFRGILSAALTGLACDTCPPGTYQPGVGQTQCLRCPAGEFSPWGASSCWRCPPAQALIVSAFLECGTCPPGRYHSKTYCEQCPTNTFKAVHGIQQCTPCEPGTTSDPGATRCESCPPGTARMSDGTCATCKPGFYYSPDSRMCFECPIDRFTSTHNVLRECQYCPHGSRAPSGSSKCVACPQGTNLLRNLTCVTCPPGTLYAKYGYRCFGCNWNKFLDRKLGQCRNCPDGTFSRPNTESCFTCPPGQALIRATAQCGTCPPGQGYNWYDLNCYTCYESYFKPAWGLQACTQCPNAINSNPERTACIMAGAD